MIQPTRDSGLREKEPPALGPAAELEIVFGGAGRSWGRKERDEERHQVSESG